MELDKHTKKLLAQLCTAINDSISSSNSVLELTEKIKESGYEIYLFLEATACLTRQKQKRGKNLIEAAAGKKKSYRLKLSQEDMKFLKTLRIKAT